MKPRAFSLSLAVRAQKWSILRNGSTVTDLFQWMFEKNIMLTDPDGHMILPDQHV